MISQALSSTRLAELADIAVRSTPANLARHLTRDLEPQYQFDKPAHIALLSRVVVDAVAGRTPKVIVSMPPQHGKSKHTSQWTPLWFLDKWPHKNIILASYAQQYAASWGRRTRDTAQRFAGNLNFSIRQDIKSSSEWETTEGGGMFSIGMGGGVAGRPAHLLIIDDLIKGSKEAQSTTILDAGWDWYQSVAEARLQPDSAQIIITTRWDANDLPGRLLATPDAHEWTVLRLPALAEENDPLGRAVGTALWPERFSTDLLLARKRNMHSYWWDTVYQQHPPQVLGNAAYRQFDPTPGQNVDINTPFLSTMPIQMAIDFNRYPGMHAVIGQHFPFEDLITSRFVLHAPGMSIIEMVQALDDLLTARMGGDKSKWPIVEVFGDATGKTTQMSDGKTYWYWVRRQLEHHGIRYQMRIKKNNPGVRDRVASVNGAFRAPDGRIRYKIHPDCQILIVDYKRVRWNGDELNDEDGELTHASSADGYRIEYLMPIKHYNNVVEGTLRAETV